MYAHNNRPGRRARACEAGWDPAIANLVERDYAFLPVCYEGDGVFYRGLDSGLERVLASGVLEQNTGTHSLAALERETGVLFVSTDLSDALAVSRLWEAPAGAAVIVIRAARLARAQEAGRAAVLGFADPGVVFRYPCFAPPLELDAVERVVVHPNDLAAATRAAGRHAALIDAPRFCADLEGRAGFEQGLERWCTAAGLTEPREAPAARWPRLARS